MKNKILLIFIFLGGWWLSYAFNFAFFHKTEYVVVHQEWTHKPFEKKPRANPFAVRSWVRDTIIVLRVQEGYVLYRYKDSKEHRSMEVNDLFDFYKPVLPTLK